MEEPSDPTASARRLARRELPRRFYKGVAVVPHAGGFAVRLDERLAKTPVRRDDLEKTIAEALDGHLCRCTGYVKYHQAVRHVVLADPGKYLKDGSS